MSNSIKIEPIKLKEFEVKQSKFDVAPKIPFRSIILGPSGSGKTILIQNLTLNVYRNCFSRIYIFSPSIDVDMTWTPVKKYIEEDLKLKESDKEKFFFNEYKSEELAKIIETQHKVIDYMKKQKGTTKLFSIMIVIDDFADSVEVSRNSRLLHSLYTRGRHNSCSVITGTQKFSALAPIIRVNATELMVYRLRSYVDLEKFIDEVSAVADKKTLLHIYKLATDEPYSFLYCDLRAKTKNEMFMIRFDKRISIDDD